MQHILTVGGKILSIFCLPIVDIYSCPDLSFLIHQPSVLGNQPSSARHAAPGCRPVAERSAELQPAPRGRVGESRRVTNSPAKTAAEARRYFTTKVHQGDRTASVDSHLFYGIEAPTEKRFWQAPQGLL